MAVNYDPVKAHEYYENYVKKGKRKGKRSTKGFSQTQKEQWEFAKEQLKNEHKQISSNITASAKERRQAISDRMKSAISQLRERLKGMSKEEKAEWKDRIQGMISDLRGEAKEDKASVSDSAKTARNTEKTAYETRKDRAYETIRAMGSKKKKK